MPQPPTPAEVDHRREEFNLWLRVHGDKLGYYKLPANLQQQVHDLMRKSYNAGFNCSRRLDLIKQRDERP